MRISKISFALIIVIIVNACTPGKIINEKKISAENAYKSQQYELAYTEWDNIISTLESKGKQVTYQAYIEAGISALTINKTDKAVNYLNKASLSENAQTFVLDSLAIAYKTTDNLSKEINTLEEIVINHPEYENINLVTFRLVDAYVRSENWDKGAEIISKLNYPDSNEKLLEDVFLIKTHTSSEEEVDVTGDKLLKINNNNIIALEYYALRYYNKGSERYKDEMDKYENNKTNKQYNILVKELKIASGDFRTSRDYFEKLFLIKPTNDYARYLGNIYANLNNKEKAEYYRSLYK